MLAIYPGFRPLQWSKKEDRQHDRVCPKLLREANSFGPLCALGHHLAKEGIIKPLCGVEIARKGVRHSPTHKLVDALMGILSGCSALYEIDFRVRPDLPLQRVFGRDRCADQSAISKTLNAFSEENVAQLREAVECAQRLRCAVFSHDFERQGERLVLEVDLSGLRASKQAEGSTKGYFSGSRNATGRRLVGVSTPNQEQTDP